MQRDVLKALDNPTKLKMLSPKSASSMGDFKNVYLAHAQFSGDAAHPTLTALARYWTRNADNTIAIDASPDAKQAELDQTLLFASMAMLGLLGVVDEMQGGLPGGKSLPSAKDELQALQDEKGSKEVD